MAWTDLSGSFTFGSKLTSTQMQNLRDNLTAMSSGTAGAPKIQTDAIQDGAITNPKLSISAILEAQIGSGAVSFPKIKGKQWIPIGFQGCAVDFSSTGWVNDQIASSYRDIGCYTWTGSTFSIPALPINTKPGALYLPSSSAGLSCKIAFTELGNGAVYYRLKLRAMDGSGGLTDSATSSEAITSSSAYTEQTITLDTSALAEGYYSLALQVKHPNNYSSKLFWYYAYWI